MCSSLPGHFLIDSVRVYQAVGDDEQVSRTVIVVVVV